MGCRALLGAIGLTACGVAGTIAWNQGYWGLLTGAALVAVWLGTLHWWMVARPRPLPDPVTTVPDEVAPRLLLDAAPTPMLAIEHGGVHALNRAARRLFATDDRILPLPPELLDPDASHVRYEGRTWRIDRVALGPRTVVALIDIEREERAAEARATAELIQVLGHELLNGLAPIASLAESGLASIDVADPALLREILSTLARRAEGLQRFAEAYRALARLPDPVVRPMAVVPLVDDLARLFAGRWPDIALTVDIDDVPPWPMDRDQINQAVWALLQNAAEAVAGGNDEEVGLTVKHTEANLTIAITDTGPGIAPGAATRIFRPFHTTKPGGSGIGLNLARQITQAHGGTLVLAPGAVTSFCLSLPGPISSKRLSDNSSAAHR